MARGIHPLPFRTGKLSPAAPMVLGDRESRAPPPFKGRPRRDTSGAFCLFVYLFFLRLARFMPRRRRVARLGNGPQLPTLNSQLSTLNHGPLPAMFSPIVALPRYRHVALWLMQLRSIDKRLKHSNVFLCLQRQKGKWRACEPKGLAVSREAALLS